MALRVPIFVLRGNGPTAKKIVIGEACLHEEEGFFDTGLITDQLYIEHPKKGDVELTENVRFIIGL